MNPLAQLLLASLISVVSSLAALRLLSRPLASVLARICPDDAAAEFWLSYTRAMLIIAPLLATLVVDGLAAADHPMAAIRWALMAALVGLLVCLFAVGRRLSQFIRVPGAGAAAEEGRS